jgi:hypothetical protein
VETTTIEDQLDAWLDDALAELGEEPADVDHAAKLLGAIRGIDRRIAEIDGLVARRIEELREFHRAQRDPLLGRRAHLERLIDGWAKAEAERTGRRTWKVPEGVIEVRGRKPRMVVDDRATVDADLLDRLAKLVPTAVKTERSLLVGEVKKVAAPASVIDGYDVPDGYEAAAVQVPDPQRPDGPLVDAPGLVLLVPRTDRAGQVTNVKPAPR